MAKKIDLTEKQAKNSPQGGVLVGKRNGQTIIYDDGKVGGWFVGKTHKEGGIKGVDKTSGQPIEVQTGEVIITAPALADQSKREFQGKMMTNRQILSKINHDAGGVAFAEDGTEVSSKMLCNGGTYNYGGKMMSDKEIAEEINKCGCEHDEDDNKFELGGHLSKGMSLEDIAKLHNVTLKELDKQVELGMKDESIHAGTYLDHFNIVKDHLVESPTFYTDESEKFHEGGYTSYKDKYNKKYGYPIDKSHDLEDISKDTGISIKGLHEIYNKGIGAFKTNHQSVRKNVTSKEQWAMARVYSAVMGGKTAKIDSHELKMNHGGEMKKENLIKDAKSGNTPARDLNNYNDMLDVEADGKVGGDSGIYAKGGLTPYDANLEGDSLNVTKSFDLGGNPGLPKVESIIITDTSYDLTSLDRKEYTNYRDFLRDVREVFIDKKEPCWLYFRINNKGSVTKLKFKDARNTNTYFNPITGKPTDLYKQIDKENHYQAINYDWSDFFSGNRTVVVNPNTSVNVTSSFAKAFDFTNTKLKVLMDKDLSIRVQQKAFDEGWEWENNHGKNLDYTSFNYLYFTKKSISIGNATSTFDNSPKREITEAEIFGNAQQATTTNASNNIITNLSNTKIWIGNNPDLSRKVQERAFELGWKWVSGKIIQNLDKNTLLFYADKDIAHDSYINKYYFDTSNIDMKEITEADLFGNAQQATTTNISNNILTDLSDTKIWIGDDPKLSKAVQERAFELGWKYPTSGVEKKSVDKATALYFYKDKTINYGELRTTFDSKINNKEIFIEDIFGTSTPNLSKTSSKPVVSTKPFNLDNTKIWVQNNPDLSRRIQDLAFAQGFKNDDGTNNYVSADGLTFTNHGNTKIIYGFISISGFENEPEKEIFEADVFGTSSQQASSTISNNLITDLSDTYININGDIELAKRVVEKAEQLGWKDNKGIVGKIRDKDDIANIWFTKNKYVGWDNTTGREITEADLFGTTSQSNASIQIPEKKSNKPKNEFTADLDKLVFKDGADGLADDNLKKDRNDLENFKKLLPSFQESKFAIEKATILKEINRLNKKITYESFIKPNEKASLKFETFTPQGLLKYYWSQSTQSPVAPLEPACELPTPNGEKSKLPMNAYLNVRTPQFKKWFGDWEKAYETNNYLDCSKMIDEETKEPKIFYHGVRKYVPNFGQFSNMGQGVVRPYGSFEPPTAFPASYFANNEDYAKFYAGDAPNMPKPSADYEPFIYKVFLNIKNPIDLLPLDLEVTYKDVIDYMTIAYGIKIQPSNNVLSLIQNDMKAKHPIWVYIRNDVSLLETIKDFGYDALIQYGDVPVFDTNGQVVSDRSKFIKDIEYLTFSPTQIKSATVKRSFYFNFFNDIRFNKGGYVRI